MRSSLKHCHEPDVGKDCRSLTAPEKHAYVSAIPGAFGITHSMAELMVGVAATGSRGPGDGFCRLPGRLMRAQR
ncbi:glutathione-dependent formaldehyde-activating GFA [Marssonina coronariae]|uniref:Glutathione-dependent formaldehyde-activating GFA n=1 Tax=Diplocarpon coronariae TaxID=2795749 RepID=A0A218Z283_9HELO|nr:glutathione-dependent formaldehyde-activating GFA [Marssonina coronariae]